MARLLTAFTHALRRPALTAIAAAAIALPTLSTPGFARGPEAVADVAEKVIDAVVNISTSQKVEGRLGPGAQQMPNLPPGSPFEEFFEEFFKNRRGQGGGGDDQGGNRAPRRVSSLGSGFIIDPAGIVVTNNHVINEADEINVILTDGTRLKAEVIGKDQKTDLAVLRVKPTKPLKAVKFGDSDALRLGEWVIAIGNPFSLGGTVTAGIVSARNRDINSGPYDNYIQTDAAINRGNSGGPLFNLEGEVIGVNTAIISPSGGSIGIGFAVPSKTVQAVVSQLQQFGEIHRGWLGVKIQQVTDEIAESLGLKPTRGALVAGIDDKGPAKPAGIEAGDVIVKFDGKDITKTDLPTRARSGIGRTFQIVRPFPALSVEDNVMVGALLRHGDPRQAMARAHEVLRRLDLYDKRSHDAGSLTLPDRKRLEVARALATEPKLLLLDEVMAGLRPTETDRMVEILKELNRGGLTILLIEHVMRAVMSLATRVLVLHHGAAIAEGLPAEVVREPAVVQSYLGAEAL